MYNLPYFKEKDDQVIFEFIRNNPFAFFAGSDKNGKPVATQLPVFIEEKGGKLFLSGHMMRNTDHHKAFEENPQVLCVFTGHHCYVSATWYSDPNQASTWNYMSVHARGNINFLDHEALVEILRKTSLYFENGNKESTTSYDNLSHDYRDPLMKAIVAFEVQIEEMDNVFKLSQNRDKESYRNIIDQLEDGDAGEKGIAEEMRKRE